MNLVRDLKQYVQKSTLFAWPLLNLKTNISPINTYFKIDGIDFKKPVIVGLFHQSDSNFQFVKSVLVNHKLYDSVIEEDGYHYFVFDLTSFDEDVEKIMTGNYSKINTSVKIKISVTSFKKIVNVGLYPELFYEEYALQFNSSIFNGDDKLELIDAPCLENETISLRNVTCLELNEKHN